jgi:hypothetical protein
MVPTELNDRIEWGNLLERVCQSVLDHERQGNVRGHVLEGHRIGGGGRPWAAWPIMPAGETATLFAPGGSGKTSLLALVALSMGLGHSLMPGVRVDRPYRVAILDWETNAETAEDLWGVLAETYKVKVPATAWYEPMEVPLERALPKVATILEKHRADCVIIDSVTLALVSSSEGGGDPAEPITRAYQALRRIGAWGLLIDHVTGADLKSHRTAIKAYGSVFKIFIARHALSLYLSERVGDTSHAYLTCPKSNVGRDKWAMPGTYERTDDVIRWEFGPPDYALYDKLNSGDEDEPETDRATPPQAERYMSALLNSYPRGMTVEAIAEKVNARSTAFVRKTLNRLSKDGLVVAVDQPDVHTREKIWVLTQTGIDLLAGAPISE